MMRLSVSQMVHDIAALVRLVLVFITRQTAKNTTIHQDVDARYFRLRSMLCYNV